MTLLVLDANAVGRGQYSAKGLRAWLNAVGEDGQVVIPEVVVWEWAEHAHAAHAELQRQLEGFRVEPSIYPTPALVEAGPVDEVVKQILVELPRSVDVWSPSSGDWRQALKNQVLQVGNGERKNGVKTGAADSIVLTCVQTQVDSREEAQPVFLATNDKGLREACRREFGDEVLLVGTTFDLLKKLNSFRPAEEELILPTQEAISDLVRDLESDIGSALHSFEMGFRFHDGPRSRKPIESDVPTRVVARVDEVDLLELNDLRIPTDTSERRVGLADVRVFGVIRIVESHLLQNADGSSSWVVMYDSPITHSFVDFTVAVTWNQNWKVEAVAPTGPAVIVLDSSEYDDSDDPIPFHAGSVELT